MIEKLQPYKGCDWTQTLRTIRNPDVHRELVRMGGKTTSTFYIRGEDANFDAIPLPVIRASHPITMAEVDMKIHTAAQYCSAMVCRS